MNKVRKIVTARGSEFAEKHLLDSSENSPIITGIYFSYGAEDGSSSSYTVEYSNGTSVEVKDVVEIWYRKATIKEEEEMTLRASGMPFN